MAKSKQISCKIRVFHDREAPERGLLVGYGALIEYFQLRMPIPEQLALISEKTRQYNTPGWIVLTPRHCPDETLYKQLIFALKYEGINLLFFKKLFETISTEEVINLISIEPLGQFSRRIWFLYEYLLQDQLNVPDLSSGNFVLLLDEKLQYGIKGTRSSRHRIVNNLPGTKGFCPLIRRTEKLDQFIGANLANKNQESLDRVHLDLLQRTAAFLLLKDSKASFTIEGESVLNQRLHRWGQAIGQAGQRPLSKNELLRLQDLVIANKKHLHMGFRTEGGFVGDHDRDTHVPLPDHISAKWQDLNELMDGWIETSELLDDADLDAVLAATILAFGFVGIHPFSDGNGRIHRYIIHHVLARKGFTRKGLIFPVSSSILEKIAEYRTVLESYSQPLLDFIEWKPTPDHNVAVLNETIDFYRYFDATQMAEFLYESVEDTIERIIPHEISWLQKFDQFKQEIDSKMDLSDKHINLLVNFMEQGQGILSARARKKEFNTLSEEEVSYIESTYKEIFL